MQQGDNSPIGKRVASSSFILTTLVSLFFFPVAESTNNSQVRCSKTCVAENCHCTSSVSAFSSFKFLFTHEVVNLLFLFIKFEQHLELDTGNIAEQGGVDVPGRNLVTIQMPAVRFTTNVQRKMVLFIFVPPFSCC